MFKSGDWVVFDTTKPYCRLLPAYLMKFVRSVDSDAIVSTQGKLEIVSLAALKLATDDDIEAGHRIDNQKCPYGYDVACLLCGFGTEDGKRIYHSWTKERPVSRRRKRKLSKQGKTVYWSMHLEQYVYVMGDKV